MEKNFLRTGIFLGLISLSSCLVLPKGAFDIQDVPEKPDYSNLDYWASSPFKEDQADRVPEPEFSDVQDSALADVFFLHPTTYTRKLGNTNWNGPVNEVKLNTKTDNGTILFQASVFNGAGRIFAPRYRQAHYQSFFYKNPEKRHYGEKALDVAYQDLKDAFEYYLSNHNEGRPIIIASHSQGTYHALRLIKEYFDGQPLMDQFVVAYLVGFPVRDTAFENITPCQTPEEIGCFCSWRSYLRGHLPPWYEENSNIVVTNPLSWTTDTLYVPKEENKGTLLRNFDEGLYPGITDAQRYEDHLWVTKPKFKGSIFITFKNYHIADYNLFYGDLRENAALRIAQYLKEHKE